MKPVVTARGYEPAHALTLCRNGVIYLPHLTYARLFAPYTAVRFFYDPKKRMVGIQPCAEDAEDAVSITRTLRGMQIRCGSLLRQFGIELTGKVPVGSLGRHGKTLTFIIPKTAIKG